MAVSAHCSTLSQTVHGTQNTLWMCTAIERNMEQQRHSTYNVTKCCVRVTSVAVEKQQVIHILSVRVCVHACVTLINQHAKRAVAYLTQSYFPHYHTNRTIS
jgi:hypothetical protein